MKKHFPVGEDDEQILYDNYIIRKIGEVAKMFDMSTETLRFIEEKSILKPYRNEEETYRIYDLSNIIELYRYISLRNSNFSIKEI